MRRSSRSLAVVFAVAWVLLPANVFAQSFQGGLRGAVRDANGVIPGVEVMLVNSATNSTRTAVTNTAGEYAYVAVEPGTYMVRAALSGFKTYERKGLTIGTQPEMERAMDVFMSTLATAPTAVASPPGCGTPSTRPTRPPTPSSAG